ncbi:MAG: iron-sulfur cluster assembly scaffold protein [bacterium]
MNAYTDEIMDHYRHPRNSKFDPNISYNAASDMDNPSCGDQIQVKALIHDGHIREISFEEIGCALSTASASMLTEMVKGKTIEEVQRMTADDVLKLLAISISPVRLKCALMPLEAIQKAIEKKS